MEKLEIILNEIERNIEFHEKCVENISKANVGWHLEHLMMVINNVVLAIEKSNSSDFKFQFKPIRFYIMYRQNIPRGKGRSPKSVLPQEEIRTIEGLKVRLETTKLSIQKLPKLEKNQFFAHPYFGNMKLKSAIKFLGIHSNHHLAIIRDIIHQ